MNFLAHLHLASKANSSLTGNLLADFVRGNPNDRWSATIVAGIRLHRRIDALTDQLPEVLQAKTLFRPATRRVAPIALDVIWDHFLAKQWHHYSPQCSLARFCQQAEQAIEPTLLTTPQKFQELNRLIWRQRWLERYAEPEQMARVLQQMANRRPRLASLADCYQDFVDCYPQLQQLFSQFYPQLVQLAEQKQL